MTDINRVVGEIRMFLQSVDRTAQPHLAGLAAELARACGEANERLNRCAGYLRQGLRSEALQLARTTPDLLDLVAALDFPERAEWDELALAYGWPRSAPVAIEIAQAVNEAYALEDPLADLLRVHRRLALARAPLPARLAVLREISALDANNSIWIEDVRRFEVVRFEQIGQESHTARQRLDAATVTALVAELESADWLSVPPESLVNSVRDSATQVKRTEARSALRALVAPLDRARTESDAVTARQLRARWESLVDTAALGARDPLWGETQVAFEWLAAEDRRETNERAFRSAVDELEQAIDGGAPQPVLAALEEAARAFGLNVPRETEARLRTRHQQLARSSRRRNHWVLAAVGASTFALVGVVAWSGAVQRREREIRRAAARVDALLEQAGVEEARSVLESLEAAYPGASVQREVAPVVERVSAAERKENERAEQFAAALAQAREAPAIQQDVPALQTARSLARLPSDRAELERLESARRAAGATERTRLNREVLARLAPLRLRLGVVESEVRRTPEDSTPLTTLRAELTELQRSAEGVSPDVRAQVQALQTRLAAIEGSLKGLIEREALLNELARKAGSFRRPEDVKSYVSLCRHYAETYPAEPRARDFARAGDARTTWEFVVEWSALIRRSAVLTDLTPKLAEERLREMPIMGDGPTSLPDAGRITAYRRYLESRALLVAQGPDNPIKTIRALLTKPVIRDASWVAAKDGEAYYTLKELKPFNDGDDGATISRLASLDGKEVPVFVRTSRVRAQGPAPHAELAKRLEARFELPGDSPGEWDAKIVAMLEWVRTAPDVDPILKLRLIQAFLQAGSSGDACLAEAVRPHAERIEATGLDLGANWVDPDDDKVAAERSRARGLIAALPAFDSCATNAAKARATLESEVRRCYVALGPLLKATDGTWHCRVAPDNASTGRVCTLGPGGAWTAIGERKSTVTDTPVKTTADLREGQLAFIETRADPRPAPGDSGRRVAQ